MSSLLSNLPSRGLLGGGAGSSSEKKKSMRRLRTPSAPVYYAVHDTAPPPEQLIVTDETNRLLARFHAIVKEREEKGRQGKRQAPDSAHHGSGSAEKRSRK